MLEVKLIGTFAIECDGKPVTISSRAAQSLFACLILTTGKNHRREKLAGMFWPDTTEEKARAHLRHELWLIRKALSSKSKVDYLIADDISISFNASTEHWLDAQTLEKLRDTSSADELIAALSNCQGELLPGFYDEWITQEREHLQAVYEQKMARLLELLESEKRWTDILEWAERWISFGQKPEVAYRYLMIAYDALGDRAKVASTYERCVQALREFDLEPSEQTRAIAFKRTSKLNIPIPLTSFIGREKELKEVAELLSKSRLVTLTGSGGVGKTRLAIQVVADILELFPDGVWFLDLAPLSDPSLVPNTFASVLGLREPADPSLSITDLLINYFRSRTALVIFDNCEHLIESCAQLINSLLTSCENLSILATSREALRVSGEVPYRVPSLEIPKPDIQFPIDELSNMESVRLFTERAAVASPEFAISPHNALAIAQICQRLDGIPLAIELAVARVKTLTVEQISKRLDDRFNLLKSGLRTALPRHQTLRATIEWSYDLLSEKERILFRRLAVFAGGWTLEAAEEVCGGNGIESSDILDLLSQLINKSLVMVETSAGEARYRRLETIRQFAREQLAQSGEVEQIHTRHLKYFLELAERSEPVLWSIVEQGAVNRLEAERKNMRVALQWSLQHGSEENSLRLASALVWFWYDQSDYVEGRYWLGKALAVCDQVPAKLHADALLKAGSLAMLQGDYEVATIFIEESGELFNALDNRWQMAWIFNLRGLIALYQGHFERVEEMSVQSLEIFEQIDNKSSIANQQLYTGMVLYYQGNNERAKSLIEKSLPVLREVDDVITIARGLHALGLVEHRLGNYAKARRLFEECLITARRRNGRLEVITALEGLGGVACVQDELIRAARLFGAAEALRMLIGAPLQPGIRGDYDRESMELRSKLDEQICTRAWSEGRAMTLEKAIQYALERY